MGANAGRKFPQIRFPVKIFLPLGWRILAAGAGALFGREKAERGWVGEPDRRGALKGPSRLCGGRGVGEGLKLGRGVRRGKEPWGLTDAWVRRALGFEQRSGGEGARGSSEAWGRRAVGARVRLWGEAVRGLSGAWGRAKGVGARAGLWGGRRGSSGAWGGAKGVGARAELGAGRRGSGLARGFGRKGTGAWGGARGLKVNGGGPGSERAAFDGALRCRREPLARERRWRRRHGWGGEGVGVLGVTSGEGRPLICLTSERRGGAVMVVGVLRHGPTHRDSDVRSRRSRGA